MGFSEGLSCEISRLSPNVSQPPTGTDTGPCPEGGLQGLPAWSTKVKAWTPQETAIFPTNGPVGGRAAPRAAAAGRTPDTTFQCHRALPLPLSPVQAVQDQRAGFQVRRGDPHDGADLARALPSHACSSATLRRLISL